MDRNTMTVLIILIIAIVIIVVVFASLWIYTPYMGGYHGNPGNNMGSNMMGY